MLSYDSHTTDAGILVIKPSGKLDAYTADDFFGCVQEQIDAGINNVIIDCSDLDYLSSVGVGTLIRIHHRTKKQNANVLYAALKGPVLDVLRLVHLDNLLGVYATIDDATEYIRKHLADA